MCHSWDLNSRYNVIIDKLIKNKSSKKGLAFFNAKCDHRLLSM